MLQNFLQSVVYFNLFSTSALLVQSAHTIVSFFLDYIHVRYPRNLINKKNLENEKICLVSKVLLQLGDEFI